MKKRRKKKERWRTRIGRMVLKLVLLTIAIFLFLSIGPPLLVRWVNPPTSSFMATYIIENTRAQGRLTLPKHQWVDWDDISPHAALAVIAAEDQRFPNHNGFDIDSITDAVEDHLEGKPLRGASTISQQTAKNLFLWPGRSWGRKALEAWMTVWLETFCSKRRILEIYLNVAQFGTGIYGIEAAAQTFFHREASQLNGWKSSLLAAVLPAPTKRNPIRPSLYMRRKAAWILDQMQRLGGVNYLEKLDKK